MKNGHFLFCELGLCRSQINQKLKLANVLVIIVCSLELVIMMLMSLNSSS